MEVKIIEGERIKPGDTLVVIPPTHLSDYAIQSYHQAAKKLGIHILMLPPHSRLYIKEAE
jgi:hypothetical protein